MSNKTEKKLRRVARKEYTEKALELQQKAVESWIFNLLNKPFKTRLKVAWRIIRGVKNGKSERV
jgi:hypothetical protein